jgi:hypothetical protein
MPVTLFFTILGIVLVSYAAAPLFSVKELWLEVPREDASVSVREMKIIREEKESYLKAIKDVDYEYALGKLSNEDYEELRDFYVKRAALIMSAFEELEEEDDRGKGS